VITEIILYVITVATILLCLGKFIEAWRDRPMVMRHPATWHYVSVRSWQKEEGYGRR
jgi:hypothetical protein